MEAGTWRRECSTRHLWTTRHLWRCEAVRIEDLALRRDRDRVDIAEGVDKADPVLRTHDEDALGQRVGAGRSRCNDGHRSELRRRPPGPGIQDVVIADTVLLEIPFVVPGGRHGGVGERDTEHHLVFVIRMPDAYDPRAPEAVADDARVATGVDHRAVDSERLEHRDALIDRVPLRNAPEVDANAGLPETHRMRFRVQLDVAVVDTR